MSRFLVSGDKIREFNANFPKSENQRAGSAAILLAERSSNQMHPSIKLRIWKNFGMNKKWFALMFSRPEKPVIFLLCSEICFLMQFQFIIFKAKISAVVCKWKNKL